MSADTAVLTVTQPQHKPGCQPCCLHRGALQPVFSEQQEAAPRSRDGLPAGASFLGADGAGVQGSLQPWHSRPIGGDLG